MSSSTRVPGSRLSPVGGSASGSRTAAFITGLLLLGSCLYLILAAIRPLPLPVAGQLDQTPDVQELRYTPINNTEGAGLASAITRANAFTPDRGDWNAYFRAPVDVAEGTEADSASVEPIEPVAGLVQVDDPELLRPDIKAALTAFALTGIYQLPEGTLNAEFIARHKPSEPSFSASPGETFEVPRTPNGQLDTWRVLGIDRSNNRVVIQGLGSNVPLALFGDEVDTSPILINETGAATAQTGEARAASDVSEPVVTIEAESVDAEQPAIKVERKSASDIEKELRALEAEGVKIDIAEIFRLMNVDPSNQDGESEDEGSQDESEDDTSSDEPETSDPA